MAKVLLINYPGYPRYLCCFMPDNGLASLAAILRVENHDVTICDYSSIEYVEQVTTPLKKDIDKLNLQSDRTQVEDMQFLNRLFIESLKHAESLVLKELCSLIRNERFGVIGFKLWWGRGAIVSIEWARKIREIFSDVLIICGGPQATIFQEQMCKSIRMDHIDAIFLGEAENTLIEYLSAYESGKASSFVNNSVIIASGRKSKRPCNLSIHDRETLPLPVYDSSVYPSLKLCNKLYIYPLEDSIGCTNQCGFCNRSWMQINRRVRSARSIWQQVEYLNHRYNATLFKFVGANTPVNIFKSLLEIYPDSDSSYQFMCFGGFESYNTEAILNAHQLGVRSIFFGLESASPDLLQRSYDKKFDVSEALETIHVCTSAAIHTTVSVIYPGPWETQESRIQTLEWLSKAKPTSVVAQIPSVLYGTKWFRDYESYNFKLNCIDPIHALLYQDYHDSLYLPLMFGQEPPFLVNGWNYRKISKEFVQFAKEVTKMLPMCTEDYLVCSEIAGYSGRVKEFTSLIKKGLYLGQIDKLRSLIININSNILANTEDTINV